MRRYLRLLLRNSFYIFVVCALLACAIQSIVYRNAALDSEDIARQKWTMATFFPHGYALEIPMPVYWETETYYRHILSESVYADVPVPFPIEWGESIYVLPTGESIYFIGDYPFPVEWGESVYIMPLGESIYY